MLRELSSYISRKKGLEKNAAKCRSMTIASMVLNFGTFHNNILLLILSAITLAFAVWLVLEAVLAFRNEKKG